MGILAISVANSECDVDFFGEKELKQKIKANKNHLSIENQERASQKIIPRETSIYKSHDRSETIPFKEKNKVDLQLFIFFTFKAGIKNLKSLVKL